VTSTPFPLKEYGLNEPRRSEEHEGRRKKEEDILKTART
jgi:hypothetical protein